MADSPSRRRKVIGSLFAIVPVVVAFAGWLDNSSGRYAEAALARSLVTFAIARTLDGAISVAQGTEVAVEPGGVGVNFALGQALDPINDLVERFSAAMLIATSSLALQGVLLEMARWWVANLALLIAAVLALVAIWRPAWLGATGSRAAIRVLSIVVFVRFAVCVFVLGSNLIFETFLATDQQAANDALTVTRTEIEVIAEQSDSAATPAPEPSLTERLGDLVDESLQALDMRERMQRLSDSVSNAVEHIVRLIVIFALQAIILPLVFLWLFAEALKKIASRAAQL
jgi:predicted membrane channel-forming protein YqfA (hemolysin III family)